MIRVFSILMVGYTEEDARWLHDLLAQNDLRAEVHSVMVMDALPGVLQQREPDVVLTDDRPDLSAKQVLALLSPLGVDVPVIALVSHQDEEMSAQLIAAGIQDFLLKTSLVRLVAVLRSCLKHIGHLRDLHEAKRALEKSEARFRAIASNLPGLVFQFVLESDGSAFFPYVSDSSRMLLGLHPKGLQAQPGAFYRRILTEDAAGYEQSMRYSCEHLSAWNWEGRIRAEGNMDIKWISLRATPRRTPRGAVLWDGIMLNITRNKQIELEIAHSRAQLEELSVYSQKAKEQERARIAREIHDDIGGTLTAIKCELVPCLDGSHRSLEFYHNKAGAVELLVDMVIDSTRRIALDLRPGVLDCGIVAAVQWQVREFGQRTGIAYTVLCKSEEISLDGDLAVAIFRIFQEALTNISKHSEASAVQVKLAEIAGQVHLEITDNGRGITYLELEKVNSFGIRGMRERCQQLGGQFHIRGESLTGTEVMIRIPVVSRELSCQEVQ